jgi:hypothetical protein
MGNKTNLRFDLSFGHYKNSAMPFGHIAVFMAPRFTQDNTILFEQRLLGERCEEDRVDSGHD